MAKAATVVAAGRTGLPRDLPALTGLRAVAACWVMLLHLQLVAGPYLDQLPLLRPLIGAGWTGVELFFVLSGFVLTLSYADSLSRPRPAEIGRFVFNRFARVWPAWAVATVVAGAWLWVMRSAGRNADVVTPHPESGLLQLLRQLTMTQQWGRDDLSGAAFIPPGWSVSAEWAAYLVFPLAAALFLPVVRHLAAPALLAGAVLSVSPLVVLAYVEGVPDTEQSWVPRIVCGFSAGMLTALATRKLALQPGSERAGLVMVWSAVGAALVGSSWAAWLNFQESVTGPRPTDHYGVVIVAFPLLIAGLSLTRRGPARLLASPPMVYAGKVSYCLYLVHFTVIEAVLSFWWRQPGDLGVLAPGLVLAVPGIIVLSCLLAAALHHGVEEPARRRLLAVLPARRPAGPVAARPVQPVTALPALEDVGVEPPAFPPLRSVPGDRVAASGRHAGVPAAQSTARLDLSGVTGPPLGGRSGRVPVPVPDRTVGTGL